ncbi:MAG: GrdX family protein [Terrisporobacter sp.]|uniref:GrdX family protein n=1 Tax=Terrisporobacter sp. TaxID=1965305 RepID=UPI002FC58A04
MIVTNNNKVYEELRNDYNIYYKECSFRDVLVYVRDKVHEGHTLLTHPLSSSIKPNETPYKSILISDKKNNLDNDSLLIIENAILSFDKFAKDANHMIKLTDKIRDDFKFVDLSIIKSALR